MLPQIAAEVKQIWDLLTMKTVVCLHTLPQVFSTTPSELGDCILYLYAMLVDDIYLASSQMALTHEK